MTLVDGENGMERALERAVDASGASPVAVLALTVAELYRYRWQVERFFKWIKQHLRIKSFFGTSENAVKSQIWIAMTVYARQLQDISTRTPVRPTRHGVFRPHRRAD
jgi:hypothetical protein